MSDTPQRRPSISQLSKTPSWVMLGFILGALFVYLLPRHEPAAPRPIVVRMAPEPSAAAARPQLTTIEAVFMQWSDFAVWDDDVTQVAMWNGSSRDFDDCYEVRHLDGAYYFRTIAHLTNRVIRHGKLPPPECPLRFTETDEQYREWREHGRFERPLDDLPPTVNRDSEAGHVSPVPGSRPLAPAAPTPTLSTEVPRVDAPPPPPLERKPEVLPPK